jgi:hypothetical protein
MRLAPIAVSLLAGALALPAFADTFDIPARKAGQWKIEIIPETGGAAPSITTEVCLDADTDKALMQAGLAMTGNQCQVGPQTRDGGAISFDATCDFGVMKTTSHTVISGDFQSSYAMQITSDTEGAPAGVPKHSVITQNATWVGACNGLQPGEMLMPGGMKVDALKAMNPGG